MQWDWGKEAKDLEGLIQTIKLKKRLHQKLQLNLQQNQVCLEVLENLKQLQMNQKE